MLSIILLVSTAIVPFTFAHSHIDEIWANGVHYAGWDPNPAGPYNAQTPGWFTTNQGGNPLYPIDLNQNQIICAKGGSPANISAPIPAGGVVRVKWWQPGEWPVSHHGPVLSYLAPCNGPCSNVNPTSLRFVKIGHKGWINPSTYDEGYWASDELRDDDNSWNIKIPTGLKAGEYILRHEIIALHVAHEGTGAYSPKGAEFYPQCINLKVTGTGTKTITGGKSAKGLYVGNEPGIQIGNLHQTSDHADYVIPGPAVWSGALTARSVES
ncbi:lytic polysaccharide monooxygenase [Aaosphaeria arxii CBS 175.79]|uniref:Lytic polysaccharide monooxygenase n=1 Tax=Aaosphaeria arxii CBS 175.79 TaxID=1450172 RepID=A0A6A5XEG6_9PLEO|nr:lytic polysaccharide monooxygenase [Aaosphaeria arxii CBS 175.79]KAF2011187.1 lytic polysaccharide monooxygenase [Aaosphaeria arxii CBS 175.79]